MKCKSYTEHSPCCTDCNSLRRDNARLRGILRAWLADVCGCVLDDGTITPARIVTEEELREALQGGPAPKRRKP